MALASLCSTVGSNTESSRVGTLGGAALLGSAVSSAAPFYYRVSPYAVVVVRYRIQQLDNRLMQQKREAESRDAFTCPVCGRQYDALDAQRLRLDPDDAMFLCECGSKLEHEVRASRIISCISTVRVCTCVSGKPGGRLLVQVTEEVLSVHTIGSFCLTACVVSGLESRCRATRVSPASLPGTAASAAFSGQPLLEYASACLSPVHACR